MSTLFKCFLGLIQTEPGAMQSRINEDLASLSSSTVIVRFTGIQYAFAINANIVGSRPSPTQLHVQATNAYEIARY